MKRSYSIILLTIIFLFLVPFINRATDGTSPDGAPYLDPSGVFIDVYGITDVYYERSSWVAEKIPPYSQFQEYPPLAVLYFSLPRFLTNDLAIFSALLITMNIICFVIVFIMLRKLLTQLQKPPNWAYVLFLPSFIFFSLCKFDIIVTLFVIAAVFSAIVKKYHRSIIFLVIAALFKWYAILLLPIIFTYSLYSGAEFRRMLRTSLLGILTFLFVVLLPFVFSGKGAVTPYVFHLQRGIEGSGVLNIAKRIVEAIPGVATSQFDFLIGLTGSLLQILPAAYIVFMLATKRKRFIARMNTQNFLRGVIVILIFFSQLGKVYSPQWELWWLPLIILTHQFRWEWYVIIAASITNYLQFPIIYSYWGSQTVLYDMIVILRSGLTLFLAGQLHFFRHVAVHSNETRATEPK